MDYSIEYNSLYEYEEEVVVNENILRVVPYDGDNQKVKQSLVFTEPKGYMTSFTDMFGNKVYRSKILEPHRSLIIGSRSEVSVVPKEFHDFDFPHKYGFDEFLLPSHLIDPSFFKGISQELVRGLKTYREVLEGVVKFVRERINYKPGITTVETKANEAFSLGVGVCQDFTHVTIGILRSLGIPSRYVMGVVNDEPRTTHAWVEVKMPDNTFAEIDPTRGILFNLAYIKFAVGRDFKDVSPVKGWFISKGRGRLRELSIKVKKIAD
ncbi:transglutaminase family protein [Acidianus sp. RZ1]|uniref:transglutaminase family protein n=1 Tax=Acidianus sp. RZ1 TaxID=1540082 RepID=UPI001491F6FB|nr:transglutaminase family protein [Acidianus sp. RZ1]NON61197.1 transglutaminase family protein [Acidianus sp. RZ1]